MIMICDALCIYRCWCQDSFICANNHHHIFLRSHAPRRKRTQIDRRRECTRDKYPTVRYVKKKNAVNRWILKCNKCCLFVNTLISTLFKCANYTQKLLRMLHLKSIDAQRKNITIWMICASRRRRADCKTFLFLIAENIVNFPQSCVRADVNTL